MAKAATEANIRHEGISPAAPTEAQRIALHMARYGVASLPRNYELFHEAVVGKNTALAQELAQLGPKPPQSVLDELGLKYQLLGHCGVAIDASQDEAGTILRDTAARLACVLQQKTSLAQLIERTRKSLAAGEAGLGAFLNEVDRLSASLHDTLAAETELFGRLQSDAEKLDRIEHGLATAHSSALTDKLTGLPNRISFDRALTSLFDGNDKTAGHALLMVDIDQFKALNTRYGTTGGDKLLKKLASVLRKSIKKNDFVARIDGDEFALLFANVGMQDAIAIADRLRNSIEDQIVFAASAGAEAPKLTISIGIALTSDATSAAQLKAHTRIALLAAQSNRRKPIQAFGR